MGQGYTKYLSIRGFVDGRPDQLLQVSEHVKTSRNYSIYSTWTMGTGRIPPPKFNSSRLNNGGWKTILSYWFLVTFQGRTVNLREGNLFLVRKNWAVQSACGTMGRFSRSKRVDFSEDVHGFFPVFLEMCTITIIVMNIIIHNQQSSIIKHQ